MSAVVKGRFQQSVPLVGLVRRGYLLEQRFYLFLCVMKFRCYLSQGTQIAVGIRVANSLINQIT